MNIGIVTVSAILGKQREIGERVNAECKTFLDKLGLKIENFGLVTSLKEADKIKDSIKSIDCLVISVATGGTEKLIRKICKQTEAITILWATLSDNSLPSCLEALSKLKKTKGNVRLIFEGISEKSVGKVGFYIRLANTIKELDGSALGVVGGPSPWLVTTTKDKNVIRNKLGVKLIKIGINELLDIICKVPELDVRRHYRDVINKFDTIQEPKEEDILQAIKIYLAMKLLVERGNLAAMTIRCFDIIQLTKNTVCLGASFLNDEGIVLGCEGDIDSVLTMIIVNKLTGSPSFMANLARADANDNTITLVHCTIATKLCDQVVARSHFECKVGVSLQGRLPLREVTICRLGENLKKMLILTGKILENLNDPTMCRTQIRIRVDGKVEELISKTLGNHHVLILGDFKKSLIEFCRLKDIKPIVIN